jgi:hypothetical protein
VKFKRNSRFFLFLRTVSNNFILEFTKHLKEAGANNIIISPTHPAILLIKEGKLMIELISYNDIQNNKLITFPNIPIGAEFIRIYEDQWNLKKEIIKSRLSSALGNNETIWARQCKLSKIEKPQCDEFLEENHLLGKSSSGFKYGLFHKNMLVAVAIFGKSRTMVDSAIYYRSYELIKFANKNNVTVVGGLQKLIKNFMIDKNVKHLMTYIDLEWGTGKAYKLMGFKETETTEPISYWVNQQTNLRRKFTEEISPTKNEFKISNLGSMKFILDTRENGK